MFGFRTAARFRRYGAPVPNVDGQSGPRDWSPRISRDRRPPPGRDRGVWRAEWARTGRSSRVVLWLVLPLPLFGLVVLAVQLGRAVLGL